ncbi:unnamed protein product, partial [Polarella glacialis]
DQLPSEIQQGRWRKDRDRGQHGGEPKGRTPGKKEVKRLATTWDPAFDPLPSLPELLRTVLSEFDLTFAPRCAEKSRPRSALLGRSRRPTKRRPTSDWSEEGIEPAVEIDLSVDFLREDDQASFRSSSSSENSMPSPDASAMTLLCEQSEPEVQGRPQLLQLPSSSNLRDPSKEPRLSPVARSLKDRRAGVSPLASPAASRSAFQASPTARRGQSTPTLSSRKEKPTSSSLFSVGVKALEAARAGKRDVEEE